jgi:hypothetical protein
MINHESQRDGTWKGDIMREDSGEKINHQYRKSSKDQGYDAKVSLRLWEGIE